MKKLFLLVLGALLMASAGQAQPRLADCVPDPTQNTASTIAYRNDHFALHMCVLDGLTGIRFEYAIPTDYAKTKWLLDLYGETATTVPGTGYIDLSVQANRAALARSISKRLSALGPNVGVMLDCLNLCAPGQQWFAVDLYNEIKAAIAPRLAMVNFGDVYSWSTPDVASPWYALAQVSTAQFCQVAINIGDGRYSLSQLSRTVSTAQMRLSQGKVVIVGILDPGGLKSATAIQMMTSPLSFNPLFCWHYHTSGDPKATVSVQYPKGLPEPTPVPALGINSDLHGRSIYQLATNWWNLRVDQAPVDPNGAAIIATIKSYDPTYGGRFHPDFTPTYGIPYVVVDASTPKVSVSFNYASESDKVGYPIPAAAKTSGAYFENGGGSDGDRHLLMLERDTWILSELSYAKWDGSKWSAGAGAVFDLKTNNRRPEGWTSTDAAGLAVLPGLVRPDEVFGGQPITHATRFSVKRTNGYVWPASHKGSSDAGAPPLGLRIRLKASKDLSGYPPELRKLFQSWKEYGLILADRGGNCYVQGVMWSGWNNGILNPAFHGLKVTDFEVIQLGWKP